MQPSNAILNFAHYSVQPRATPAPDQFATVRCFTDFSSLLDYMHYSVHPRAVRINPAEHANLLEYGGTRTRPQDRYYPGHVKRCMLHTAVAATATTIGNVQTTITCKHFAYLWSQSTSSSVERDKRRAGQASPPAAPPMQNLASFRRIKLINLSR